MCVCVCMCVFSHIWLFCDPMDCSPPGSSVYGFPSKNTEVSCHSFLQGIFPTPGLCLLCLLHWQILHHCWHLCVCLYTCLFVPNSSQSYGRYSKQGSSVHGVFQARILGCVVISSSSVSSWPRDWTCNFCASRLADEFFTAEPLGNPWEILKYLWEAMIWPTFYPLCLTSRSFWGFWLCPSNRSPAALYSVWVSTCLWDFSVFMVVLIFQ